MRLKRHLWYGVLRVLVSVMRRLPRELALVFGASFGYALHLSSTKDDFRACRNLAIAYGNRYSTRQAQRLARQAFINAGVNACDTARLCSHYTDELSKIIDVDGFEFLKRAYERGKGVICATGHIGNFELLAAWCGRSGFKTAVVARSLYDRRLDAILVANREVHGISNISVSAPKKLASLLKQGYVVGVLLDFDSHRVKSEFVESCGRLANTPIGPARFGLRLESAFVPVTCQRCDGRYRLSFHQEIFPRTFGQSAYGQRLSAVDLTWRVRQKLDETIETDPTQWTWNHNRWHNRPLKNGHKPPGLALYESYSQIRVSALKSKTDV